jgi:hypothetical protein
VYSSHPGISKKGFFGVHYLDLLSRLPLFAQMLDSNWNVLALDSETIVLEHKLDGTVLSLPRPYGVALLGEYKAWEEWYLPEGGLRGKTVLDVGAGGGESAWFFLAHSAGRVIGIEPSVSAFESLKSNAVLNHWNVTPVGAKFTPSMLSSYPHDFLKFDAEGAEVLLLDDSVKALGPCRIELHGNMIGRQAHVGIIRKFGLSHIGYDIWGRDDHMQ